MQIYSFIATFWVTVLLTLSKNFFMKCRKSKHKQNIIQKWEKKSLYKNGLAIYTMPVVVDKMLSFRSLFREKMPYVTWVLSRVLITWELFDIKDLNKKKIDYAWRVIGMMQKYEDFFFHVASKAKSGGAGAPFGRVRCVVTCLTMWAFCRKDRWQMLQVKGFSPVWIFKCCLKLNLLLLMSSPQTGQHLSSDQWSFICKLKLSRLPKRLLHLIQSKGQISFLIWFS